MKTIILNFLILITIQLSLFGNNQNELIDDVFAPSVMHSKTIGAIIINENNSIDIIGRKSAYIIYSITKKMKIRILDSTGIGRYSKITLPETFDPTYISHFPKDRNYTYVFSKLNCNYFKATITTKDGEIKKAKIIKTIEQIKMVMVEMNVYGDFEKYNYQIDNLSIGDEVTIEYNYDINYLDNFAKLSSFRIFFNNNLYKENYHLTISHHSDLNIKIAYKNNASPDSVVNIDNKKTYYWNKRNLYGCINEVGSRPYLSLPYLIFSITPDEMLYTLPYSFDEKYIPFYSLYSYQREKNHLGIAKSVSQGVKTKQYMQIDKFISKETQGNK